MSRILTSSLKKKPDGITENLSGFFFRKTNNVKNKFLEGIYVFNLCDNFKTVSKKIKLKVTSILLLLSSISFGQNSICSEKHKSLLYTFKLIDYKKASISRTYFDSLFYQTIKNCPKSNNYLSALVLKGRFHETLNEPDSAFFYYKKLADLKFDSSWKNQNLFLFRMSGNKGVFDYLFNKKQYEKAESYLLQYEYDLNKTKSMLIEWSYGLRHEIAAKKAKIQLEKDEVNRAYLTLLIFSNKIGGINIKEELLFPTFKEIIEKRFSSEERKRLEKYVYKNIKFDKNRKKITTNYDLFTLYEKVNNTTIQRFNEEIVGKKSLELTFKVRLEDLLK